MKSDINFEKFKKGQVIFVFEQGEGRFIQELGFVEELETFRCKVRINSKEELCASSCCFSIKNGYGSRKWTLNDQTVEIIYGINEDISISIVYHGAGVLVKYSDDGQEDEYFKEGDQLHKDWDGIGIQFDRLIVKWLERLNGCKIPLSDYYKDPYNRWLDSLGETPSENIAAGDIINFNKQISIGEVILRLKKGNNLNELDLRYVNLSGIDLEAINFNDLNLEHADLSYARLHSAFGLPFPYQHLRKTLSIDDRQLRRKIRTEVFPMNFGEFLSSSFVNTNLTHAHLIGTYCHSGDFSNVLLDKSICVNASLIDSKFLNSIISESDFTGSDLSSSKIQSENIENSNFANAELKSINLDNSKLANCDFNNAKFGKSQIKKTRFDQCLFESSDFGGSIISGSNFFNCNFIKTIFTNVKFNKVDFTGSVIKKVSFEDANLNKVKAKYVFLDEERLQRIPLNREFSETEFSKWLLDSMKEKSIYSPDSPSVFLSYAWKDKEAVLAIDQWLRNAGVRVMIDEREFVPGNDLYESMINSIKNAGKVIAFWSKSSKDRYYPELERRLSSELEAQGRKDGKKVTILIYLCLDDTPLPPEYTFRLAIKTNDRSFNEVCEEIWRGIFEKSKEPKNINLEKYTDNPPW